MRRAKLAMPVGTGGDDLGVFVLDLVIRNGVVVDGTGAPSRRADVGVVGDRIVAVEAHLPEAAAEIDAGGRVVTPGFVDVHTHLDAQLAWDPLGTSSCWHGVTSVVLGNCGVTFAPARPDDRAYLAQLMESVEDIPATSILEGLAWDWETYGEYLDTLERLPKGLNVGGMVGHCAVRYHAMGDRSLDEAPATRDDIVAMCALVDEAIGAGALGFSTSRTFLHRVPDGRPVPGTFAAAEELLAFADVMGKHGGAVFEGAMRLGERDGEDLANTMEEIELMAELSRRARGPVTFGLVQVDRRPELYRRVIERAKACNAAGASLRPQTTARGVGLLFGLSCSRTFWDRCPSWRQLRNRSLPEQLAVLEDAALVTQLVAEAASSPAGIDLRGVYVLDPRALRYDARPQDSLAAVAEQRGTSPAEAFLELTRETSGAVLFNFPFLNQQMAAVAEMLADPVVAMGLADAGAHVGQIMDASQPTFLLSYWVAERGEMSFEEAVRRLTSDTAELFGIADRGVVRPGAFADLNVIDVDRLAMGPPTYVHDFPGGAGRFVQRATGYDCTIVNGQVFMRHGEHTGAFAGRVLRRKS